MSSLLIQRFRMQGGLEPSIRSRVLAPVRLNWGGLGHLLNMNSEQLAELGLERLLTTSELADYLGLRVQAIYDLRAEGRGRAAFRWVESCGSLHRTFAGGCMSATNPSLSLHRRAVTFDGWPSPSACRNVR